MTTNNEKNEIPTNFFVERDVLGQEKGASPASPTKATPNRIFIIVAVLAAVAIVYWLVTGR